MLLALQIYFRVSVHHDCTLLWSTISSLWYVLWSIPHFNLFMFLELILYPETWMLRGLGSLFHFCLWHLTQPNSFSKVPPKHISVQSGPPSSISSSLVQSGNWRTETFENLWETCNSEAKILSCNKKSIRLWQPWNRVTILFVTKMNARLNIRHLVAKINTWLLQLSLESQKFIIWKYEKPSTQYHLHSCGKHTLGFQQNMMDIARLVL